MYIFAWEALVVQWPLCVCLTSLCDPGWEWVVELLFFHMFHMAVCVCVNVYSDPRIKAERDEYAGTTETDTDTSGEC